MRIVKWPRNNLFETTNILWQMSSTIVSTETKNMASQEKVPHEESRQTVDRGQLVVIDEVDAALAAKMTLVNKVCVPSSLTRHDTDSVDKGHQRCGIHGISLEALLPEWRRVRLPTHFVKTDLD